MRAAALGTVIVCPGGNYEFLCAHEAFPVAAWLASHGIAAVVLRYRLLPKYGLEEAMDDLEAAVAHVRKTRGGLVGAIGFRRAAPSPRSAGGRARAARRSRSTRRCSVPVLDPREWDDGACEDPTLMFFNRGDERYPPRAQSLLTGGEALKGGAGFAAAPNSLAGPTGDDTMLPKEHLDLYAAACKREGKSFHYIRRNLGGHGFCLNEAAAAVACARAAGRAARCAGSAPTASACPPASDGASRRRRQGRRRRRRLVPVVVARHRRRALSMGARAPLWRGWTFLVCRHNLLARDRKFLERCLSTVDPYDVCYQRRSTFAPTNIS